jgi:predicted DNA-binding protein
MAENVSAIVSVRVSSELGRRLEREARRRGLTKSEEVREILEDALGAGVRGTGAAEEARRQSLLVSARASERDALALIERLGDRRGW